MLNVVQVVQASMDRARQTENVRTVNKLYLQRLEEESWGVHIEGLTRDGATITVRMRMDADGAFFRL